MAAVAATSPAAVRNESWLERTFGLQRQGVTVGNEVRAGLTTFMVMAYIIFVNPSILSAAQVPFPAALAATCLVAAIATLAMGLLTNYPLAIAPGMGLNAFVAFTLVLGMGLPWEAAMGVIFLEGIIITILVLTGLREAILNAFPMALKRGIAVGIGLFIMFIGLINAGLVRVPVESIAPPAAGSTALGQPGTPLALASFASTPLVIAVIGLLLTIFLVARRVPGALLIGIVLTTVIAVAVRYATGATVSSNPNVASIPNAIVAMPDFSTLGAGLNFQVFTQLGVLAAVLAIFSVMLSDFFDTVGTVTGIGAEAGWLDQNGQLPRLRRVLLVDSLAAALGGAAGSSSATTYIESAAGVSEGGKTGLVSVVVAILFALCLFLSPIAGIVPPEATAPALILVGFYMAAAARGIDFADIEEGLPALFTMVVMPLTYSITNGIGAGAITYVVVKLARGKVGQIHPMMWVTALAFLIYFAMPALRSWLGI